jgi:hypothetical protein
MMRALIAMNRPDFALAVAEEVADELGAVVFTREKFEQLQRLATREPEEALGK